MNTEQLHLLIRNPRLLNTETEVELKQLTEDYPWFQMGWVLYLKSLKSNHSALFDEVLKEVAVRVLDRKVLHAFLNDQINAPSLKMGLGDTSPFSLNYSLGTGEQVLGGDSLIDKFLSDKSGGIKRPADAENPGERVDGAEILERSAAEYDELVTETLANLLFQQKNYEKAMKAYQKLSLKYPEKSVYFASRIKEIEEIKNINKQ